MVGLTNSQYEDGVALAIFLRTISAVYQFIVRLRSHHWNHPDIPSQPLLTYIIVTGVSSYYCIYRYKKLPSTISRSAEPFSSSAIFSQVIPASPFVIPASGSLPKTLDGALIFSLDGICSYWRVGMKARSFPLSVGCPLSRRSRLRY